MKKIIRFLRAVYCWAIGGCKLALSADERMQICKKCDYYLRGKCLLCGCVLKAKTKMDTEKCPIDKW